MRATITNYESAGGIASSQTMEFAGRVAEVIETLDFLGYENAALDPEEREALQPRVVQQTLEIGIKVEGLDAFKEALGAGHYDLEYIQDNLDIPDGMVSSTARRGRKWYDRVDVGDVVNIKCVETGEIVGRAAVVLKELMPYHEVIENADHNHVNKAFPANPEDPGTALAAALERAYGPLLLDEEFTVLHILPLND